VIGDMISPVKSAVGPAYGELDARLQAAVHIRFALPAELPQVVKKAIKRADRVSAWLEATQIAGFSQAESDRFFGKPDPRIISGHTITLRPPVEVRNAFIARHEKLLKALN
jgi:5'-deoxynucleotidase YfbR-like HD superfamily hydrolase